MTDPRDLHLCYCTNVHAYRDLAGLRAVLEGEVTALGARLRRDGLLAAGEALGVGLWLPVEAAREVAARPGPLVELLARLQLEVRTVNAFPYGAFHAERVKDEVFRPSWAEPERLRYTLDAAAALAALIPEGASGSVSTHSGAYKPWGAEACDGAAVARGLIAAAEGLARLEERTGRRILLALEPEPLSLLETTEEVLAFFAARLQPAGAAARRHLGLCFDACHQAVQFEDLPASMRALARGGVPLAKVQLSAAIVLADPALDRERLRPWAEDRWFHQVVARLDDGSLARLPDLPEALADEHVARAREWRVHYHVPVFAEQLDEEGRLATTRPDLERLIDALDEAPDAPQLEIETYTWGLIPEGRRRALGVGTLVEGLAREWAWVRARLGGHGSRAAGPAE